jgi:hypothetical protein
MICAQLVGGLGNQMFQYACGRALAAKHRTELLLDCSILQDKTPRPNFTIRDYELDIFPIDAKKASVREQKKYRPSLSYRGYYKLRKTIGLPIKANPNYLIEQNIPCYNAAIEDVSKNCFLSGYWQSEKYFKPIESIIRQDFTYQQPLDRKNALVANRICTGNSVGLHMRRGDYAENPLVSSVHALCPMEYYERAIYYIMHRISNPVFFIFSDDIEWVGSNLHLSGTFEHVSGNIDKQSYVDMQLMSLCQHNVIANSSFSWWGAWLNTNPSKIVIAPKKWYVDDVRNGRTKDLVPETWIRL